MDKVIESGPLLDRIKAAQTSLESNNDVVWEMNKKYFKGLAWARRLIDEAPAADVAPMEDLKEFAEDVVYQFGYRIHCNGGLHLTAGGLSTLEKAFDILGWEDPKPYPEGECEMYGCHEYATCGINHPDGYKRVCGKHYAELAAELYTPVEGR